MSADRESVIRYVEEIEARCNSIAGPTYAPEDMEAFQAAARSDIPSLCRGIRAAVAITEHDECGLSIDIARQVARAMRPRKE